MPQAAATSRSCILSYATLTGIVAVTTSQYWVGVSREKDIPFGCFELKGIWQMSKTVLRVGFCFSAFPDKSSSWKTMKFERHSTVYRIPIPAFRLPLSSIFGYMICHDWLILEILTANIILFSTVCLCSRYLKALILLANMQWLGTIFTF